MKEGKTERCGRGRGGQRGGSWSDGSGKVECGRGGLKGRWKTMENVMWSSGEGRMEGLGR